MDNKIIYSKRGAGRLNVFSLFGAEGTWPFAKLILRQNDLSFSLLGSSIDLKYSDIKEAIMNKDGFLYIFANKPEKSFSFAGVYLFEVINQLRAAGVKVNNSVYSNRLLAEVSALLWYIILVCFIIALFFYAVILGVNSGL